jgi:uncharacterized low-complexity protein
MRSTMPQLTGALALALLLAAAVPALAQQGSDDTGGTTGQMTTTPEAKSDDAAGTAGESAEPGDVSATPDEAAGGERDCEATEKWDEQAMACVPK